MRERIRRGCGRCLTLVAAHSMKLAERLLDRDRPSAHSTVKEPDPTCTGCSKCPVPGVFWPVQINGDKTRGWIERCDQCRRFDNDIQAAAELLRLGLTNELGIGKPAGSIVDSPFAPPIGQHKRTRK